MFSSFIARAFLLQGAVPVLLDTALKGAILIAIAGAAAYALRNRSAASRHAVWTAAVVGHIAIPALVFLLPAWTLPVLPAADWMQRAPAATASNVGAARASTVSTAKSTAPQTTSGTKLSATTPASIPGTESANPTNRAAIVGASVKSTPRVSRIQIFALAWFLGAIAVLLRLAVGTWKVGQLARDGYRVEDGVWLSLTQRLANRLGVTRPLTLLRGSELAVPVTWGVLYPAVLLPNDADNWPEERRRFVLVHEMAHVKRFDALTQLIAQIAIALFWFDPLVWIAAHQMRVEREHACDDYVLRDGTAPSLYAGELLEMVRSIGTRRHDHAAPAFAALAMARRSEFEGRMLAILDPKLNRRTLNRRSTVVTGVAVALLALPLAAWRPFQQPSATPDDFPRSFKVSLIDPNAPKISLVDQSATPSAATTSRLGTLPATSAIGAVAPSSKPGSKPSSSQSWTCDASFSAGHSGTHINVTQNGSSQIIQYMSTTGDRCAEAAVIGPAKFSADEAHIAQLSPGGFARFRERTPSTDRTVSVVPVGDGSLSYSATLDGRVVPFDDAMQHWLSGFLPEVLREASINVPERVARLRAQGGVPAVLKTIAEIHSVGSRGAHYRALLQGAPLSTADAEKVAIQAPADLASSSGELSSIIRELPRSAMQDPAARRALAAALPRITSSGDRASTLQILAPTADPELLVMLARAAEDLPSSGDKENYLTATAAEYLATPREALRNAYFKAASTVPSSGDLENVLLSAMPYGHADPEIALLVVDATKAMGSSGDVANVLISLVSERVILPNATAATLAVINRASTLASSGDRANVLISVATQKLLTTRDLKDAFVKAAMAVPSEGDRANVLAAAAGDR
jgi:beta-lactamase regulating signal transducer with metallopeptidase domain